MTDAPPNDRPENAEPQHATPEAPAEPTSPPVAPWRLLRLREGKVLGGVAGGIGRAAGVDLSLARLAVAVGCLTGFGLVAYLVLWLVVPQEAPWRGDVARRAPEPTRNYLGIGLLVAAVLGVLDLLGTIGGALAWTRGNWSFNPGPHHTDFGIDFGGALGLILIGFGAAVLLTRRRGQGPDGSPPPSTAADEGAPATYPGGAGSGSPWTLTAARIVGWLAVLWALIAGAFGLVLWWAGAVDPGTLGIAFPLAVVALSVVVGVLVRSRRPSLILTSLLVLAVPFAIASQADLDGELGVRSLRINDDNFEESYRVAAGQLILDLRDMEVLEGTRRLDVDMGAGQITVKLPANVISLVTARADVGAVAVLGQERGGTKTVVQARSAGCPERGQLLIDLRTRLGHIEVEGPGVPALRSCVPPGQA